MSGNQSARALWSDENVITDQKRLQKLVIGSAVRSGSEALLSLNPGRPAEIKPIFASPSIHFRPRSVPALASCVLASAMLILSCSHARAQASEKSDTVIQKGVASYYSRAYQGRRTASGSRYNPKVLTAAHPWLPFGTKLRVTAANGRSIDVVVTDRMTAAHRIIDLSYQAARMLGIIQQGVAYVSLSRV